MRITRSTFAGTAVLLAGAWPGACPSPAAAQTKLGDVFIPSLRVKDVVSRFAGTMAYELRKNKKTAVAVGDFSGPIRRDANAGPGIQKLLIDELKRNNITVSRDADVTVRGTYVDIRTGGPSDHVVLKLRAEMRDAKDNRL